MTYFKPTSQGGGGFRMESGLPEGPSGPGGFFASSPCESVGDFVEARAMTPVSFSFRLANFAPLQEAWGRPRARALRREIANRLVDLVGEGAAVRLHGADAISALLVTPDALGGVLSDEACNIFVRSFCNQISLTPVQVDGVTRHVLLTGSWRIETAGSDVVAAPDATFNPTPQIMLPANDTGDDAAWAEQYQSDIVDASELFELLSNDRLTLAWQPIRSAVNDRDVLYHEALSRRIGGECDELGQRIPAAERLGLCQAFDRYVVERVIARLRADPAAVLGVNISAQSAVLLGWWNAIVAELRERPDLAQRLVIEITETAELPPLSLAVAFAETMRKLGCRIALDDFGAGHSSLRTMLALQPEIVKIDGFFIQSAGLSPAAEDLFGHLVGLARALGAVVVVEGIETAEQADLALFHGVQWHQGRHPGAPIMHPATPQTPHPTTQ